MLRRLLIVAPLFVVAWGINREDVWAMGGDLKRPTIAMSRSDKNDRDFVEGVMSAFSLRERHFTGGYFVNARTVLCFSGGTKTVNGLLEDLSRIDGAVLNVRFSKGTGTTPSLVPDKLKAGKTCDCTIEHNGEGFAHDLTVTIYLGGEDVDVEKLEIPPIRNHSDGKTPSGDARR
jgi:hypothetical protein